MSKTVWVITVYNRTFLEVGSMMVSWWILAFLRSEPSYNDASVQNMVQGQNDIRVDHHNRI